MAWIRLDDQIGHHPKFLKAGVASWLYVCCIGFAQKFLTDGFIPNEAIATLSGGVQRPLNYIKTLVKVGLLERVPGGYQVHDYLDFNDSAETVRRKRELDRKRKMSERTAHGIPSESERIPRVVLARAPASHPIPSYKEQKIRTVAAPPPSPRHPVENVKIITKIAHEVIISHNGQPTSGADLCDEIKDLCAARHIPYNTLIVRKALDSAEVQRKKARS